MWGRVRGGWPEELISGKNKAEPLLNVSHIFFERLSEKCGCFFLFATPHKSAHFSALKMLRFRTQEL